MKTAEVDGTNLTAFIDMGSDSTIINESTAKQLNWKWDDNKIRIKGYAGGIGYAIGNTTKEIIIDNYKNKCEILIVPDYIQQEGLLIGLNYFDNPNVEVIYGGDQLKIINRSKNERLIEANRFVLKDIRVGQDTSDYDTQRLRSIIEKHNECFSDDLSNIGCTSIEEMTINIKENKIIRRVPYRVPYGMLPEMERTI